MRFGCLGPGRKASSDRQASRLVSDDRYAAAATQWVLGREESARTDPSCLRRSTIRGGTGSGLTALARFLGGSAYDAVCHTGVQSPLGSQPSCELFTSTDLEHCLSRDQSSVGRRSARACCGLRCADTPGRICRSKRECECCILRDGLPGVVVDHEGHSLGSYSSVPAWGEEDHVMALGAGVGMEIVMRSTCGAHCSRTRGERVDPDGSGMGLACEIHPLVSGFVLRPATVSDTLARSSGGKPQRRARGLETTESALRRSRSGSA
jgi:hypothetical protein